MSDYRRYFVAGGAYFFTLVTQNRAELLINEYARQILGDAFRLCQQRYPFEAIATVLLPDHLHCIWSLPPGDLLYAKRWSFIKSHFTREWLARGGSEQPLSSARNTEARRGVWQRRYWEHTIRDERDLENHVNYIHYNPVKHGYASNPQDWKWSSFHRFVLEGEYEPGWGSRHTPANLPESVGE